MIFLISLVLGILLIIFGKKLEKMKIIFIIIGIALAVFGAYGIFTSFL